LDNVGHSIATDIQVAVKIIKRNVRGGNATVLLPIDVRIPRIKPADNSPGHDRQPFYKEYPLALSKDDERLIGSGQLVIIMDGAFSYENGFDRVVKEPICVTYSANYYLSEDGKSIAGSGDNATCEDFSIRLPSILQNHEAQQKLRYHKR
jgi:hypothetical protein